MKALLFLLLMAGRVAAAPAVPAPLVTIELRDEVQAMGGLVTLGQLARLGSPDLSLLRLLVDLPIGRAPAAGDSVVLEREALAASLRRRLALHHEQVAWQGTSSTRVASASQVVAGDEIAAAAAVALHAWLAARSTRSEVSLAIAPRDVDAVQGELRLQPRPLANAQLRSRMTVWVEVWAGARFVRAVPVSFSVAAWGEGLAAAAPLARGASLHAGAGPGEVDLLAREAAPLADAQGMRLRRALAAGEPVGRNDVEAVPDVQRGEWAALRSGLGAVRTEARVQVLQDGRIGDSVRVRSASASLLARVTGAGQLEVAR